MWPPEPSDGGVVTQPIVSGVPRAGRLAGTDSESWPESTIVLRQQRCLPGLGPEPVVREPRGPGRRATESVAPDGPESFADDLDHPAQARRRGRRNDGHRSASISALTTRSCWLVGDAGEHRQRQDRVRRRLGHGYDSGAPEVARERRHPVDRRRIVDPGPDPGGRELGQHPVPLRHPDHVQVPDVLVTEGRRRQDRRRGRPAARRSARPRRAAARSSPARARSLSDSTAAWIESSREFGPDESCW